MNIHCSWSEVSVVDQKHCPHPFPPITVLLQQRCCMFSLYFAYLVMNISGTMGDLSCFDGGDYGDHNALGL